MHEVQLRAMEAKKKKKSNYFYNGTLEIYEWDSVMWLPEIAKIWT